VSVTRNADSPRGWPPQAAQPDLFVFGDGFRHGQLPPRSSSQSTARNTDSGGTRACNHGPSPLPTPTQNAKNPISFPSPWNAANSRRRRVQVRAGIAALIRQQGTPRGTSRRITKKQQSPAEQPGRLRSVWGQGPRAVTGTTVVPSGLSYP